MCVIMKKRFELRSGLQGETLVRKGMMKRRPVSEQIRIAPGINVIKIGGHGAIDYGREVMHPLCEEIGELSKKHQLLVVTGGGGRVRHIMDIGMDLGMPTGVLAELSAKISEQNAIMVSILLSKYSGTRIHTGDLLELPMLLKLGILPVIHGTPPVRTLRTPGTVRDHPPASHGHRCFPDRGSPWGKELHHREERGRALHRGSPGKSGRRAHQGYHCE